MIITFIGLHILQILNVLVEGTEAPCPGTLGQNPGFCTNSGKDISNEEILAIGQKIWDSDTDRLNVDLNLQGKVSANKDDKAKAQLCRTIPNDIYTLPVYEGLISLFDNYITDDSKKEEITSNEWEEVDAFLDEIMKTEPMKITQEFLASKGLVSTKATEFQETLKTIWFSNYKRSKALSSSGAEHILIGEFKSNKVSGLHNWVRYCLLEKNGNVNYLGYEKIVDLEGAYLLQAPFLWDNHLKSSGSFFIGTSPAFDLSVFTLCFYARQDGKCKLNLNGHPLKIQTHTIEYDGKIMVGSAYPEI